MTYLISRTSSITENFHGAEVFVTTRQTNNTIIARDEEEFERINRNIRLTAQRMESVRKILGDRSISINSWYRNPELNALVGGSKNSDHMQGAAIDFICPKYGTPAEICKQILRHPELAWKQLIFEHTWAHISFDFTIPYTPPKLQVLTLLSTGKYTIGITDKSGFKL
jgi:hypothetical protein